MRWVHQYSPVLEKKIKKYLRKCNDSCRVDETYIKVNGKWTFIYISVDSNGDTIYFYLSKHRDSNASRKFFRKALKSSNSTAPRVITVDKNPAYIKAITDLKIEKKINENTSLRRIKYLNNIIDQDHRFIKRRLNIC